MKKRHKVANLVSEQQDQMRLNLFSRIALAVHLSLYPRYREYEKQLALVNDAMHKTFR